MTRGSTICPRPSERLRARRPAIRWSGCWADCLGKAIEVHAKATYVSAARGAQLAALPGWKQSQIRLLPGPGHVAWRREGHPALPGQCLRDPFDNAHDHRVSELLIGLGVRDD